MPPKFTHCLTPRKPSTLPPKDQRKEPAEHWPPRSIPLAHGPRKRPKATLLETEEEIIARSFDRTPRTDKDKHLELTKPPGVDMYVADEGGTIHQKKAKSSSTSSRENTASSARASKPLNAMGRHADSDSEDDGEDEATKRRRREQRRKNNPASQLPPLEASLVRVIKFSEENDRRLKEADMLLLAKFPDSQPFVASHYHRSSRGNKGHAKDKQQQGSDEAAANPHVSENQSLVGDSPRQQLLGNLSRRSSPRSGTVQSTPRSTAHPPNFTPRNQHHHHNNKASNPSKRSNASASQQNDESYQPPGPSAAEVELRRQSLNGHNLRELERETLNAFSVTGVQDDEDDENSVRRRAAEIRKKAEAQKKLQERAEGGQSLDDPNADPFVLTSDRTWLATASESIRLKYEDALETHRAVLSALNDRLYESQGHFLCPGKGDFSFIIDPELVTKISTDVVREMADAAGPFMQVATESDLSEEFLESQSPSQRHAIQELDHPVLVVPAATASTALAGPKNAASRPAPNIDLAPSASASGVGFSNTGRTAAGSGRGGGAAGVSAAVRKVEQKATAFLVKNFRTIAESLHDDALENYQMEEEEESPKSKVPPPCIVDNDEEEEHAKDNNKKARSPQQSPHLYTPPCSEDDDA